MTYRCTSAVCFCLFIWFILFATVPAFAGIIERRAAFDIGSAAIKCTIADVDIEEGRMVKLVAEESRKVDFAEDMARSYDRNFSNEIMDKGLAALRELKTIALDEKAVAFSAVGGSIFDTARNARAYFATIKSETGIPCRFLSKQQASLLSFHAVQQTWRFPKADILVWDIGGDSMEMTARNLDGSLTFYVNKTGSVSFKNIVISKIQNKDIVKTPSPNPMSDEQTQLALGLARIHAETSVPHQLAKRIESGTMNVIGIGGVHYYSIPELTGGREATYTRDDVEDAIKKWAGKNDEDFDSEYAQTRYTNLILVLGYMEALGINTVTPLKINQATGLLVTPEFW